MVKLRTLEFALHVEIPCSAQYVLKIEIEAVRRNCTLQQGMTRLRTCQQALGGPSKLR